MAAANNPSGATLRKLFGGAMECLLPAAYMDVSDLRQVPDHQEAFVSREDGVSIVVEVLSFEADISMPSESDGGDGRGGSSARHFFDDLAAANGATASTCDFCADMTDSIMPKLPGYSKAALVGRQTVAKFREDAPPEAVRLYLVNVRLPHVGTDLLITVNVPHPDEDAAASSPASAECFLPTTAAAAAADTAASGEASPGAAQAPTVAGGALASEGASSGAGTEISREEEEAAAERAGEEERTEKVLSERARVVDAPEGFAREEAAAAAAGTRAAAEGGDEDGRLIFSSAGGGDLDAGVAALRPLLHSFAILEWSLFG